MLVFSKVGGKAPMYVGVCVCVAYAASLSLITLAMLLPCAT